MIDDEDGEPVPFEAPEQPHEFVLLNMVETGPRLIEKQKLWAAGKRAGDFYKALMPIAQAADARAGTPRKANEIECRQRVPFKLTGGHLIVRPLGAHHDVIQDGHGAKQPDVLEGTA